MTAPNNLFDLIWQRTEEGKIPWTGDAYKLMASVAGMLELVLLYHSDERDGDWYQLTVTTSGDKQIRVGIVLGLPITQAELAALYKLILDRPHYNIVTEATEILKSL